MPANLSLVLNLILLVAVVIAISRLMKTRRQKLLFNYNQPLLEPVDNQIVDEIIAVRKLTADFNDEQGASSDEKKSESLKNNHNDESRSYVRPAKDKASSVIEVDATQRLEAESIAEVGGQNSTNLMIMMFLLAKEQRQFAGYELLQTVLAAGLRFGEGDLFHRHYLPNGQGPVLFSLAAATASGVFDLQNIGAFNARGLCLYMQTSGNSTIDMDRFNVLYETARQLSEGLDAHLLDEQRRPLTKEGLLRYQRILSESAAS